MKGLSFLLMILALPHWVFANGSESFDGKYSVFVYVAFIVLGGLFLYLFRLEKKVSKLEKKIEEEL